MKTKLMIAALMFCSSLSLGADPARPSTKTKPVMKVVTPPTTTNTPQIDEAVLGGLGTGTSAPSKKVVRGGASSAPQPTR